jgi:hypothetical protein
MMPMELYSEPDIAHFRTVCRSVRILLRDSESASFGSVYKCLSFDEYAEGCGQRARILYGWGELIARLGALNVRLKGPAVQ